MNINWQLKDFNELTPPQLYDILRLRSEVFVVEQNCVYLDMDGKDAKSFHLCGYDAMGLVAYTRLLPPGLSYAEASIGRVVTSPVVRRSGAGRLLMLESINAVYKLYGHGAIKIGAQLYLKDFYASLGFEQCSDVYLEDGIAHIEMVKRVL